MHSLLLYYAFWSGDPADRNLQRILESYGFTPDFAATDFLIGRWPFLILVPLWAFTMGYKIAPEKPVVPVSLVTVSKREKAFKPFLIGRGNYFLWRCCFVYFWRKLGIPSWLVCFTGACLLCLRYTDNERGD